MIGSRAKSVIVMRSEANALTRRALCKFDATPLIQGENQLDKEKCFFTTGLYTIKYKPKDTNVRCADTPFVINGDMFNNNAHHYRFKDYEQLVEASKTDKRVKWMLDNTTFTKGLIEIAKNHIDLPIPFSFNTVKYYRNLKKRGKPKKRFLQEVE